MDNQKSESVPVRKTTAGRDGERAIATKLAVDRDGEVVVPRGVEPWLERYEKGNPVLLWQHNQDIPAVGAVEDIKVSDDEISYVPRWGSTPFAQELKALWADDILRASSIGFRPVSASPDPILPEQKGMTIKEWEWLETSVVNIGANQEALRRAVDGSHALKSYEDLLVFKQPTIGNISGSFRGTTVGDEDHQHSFIVELEDGKVVHAATSIEKSEASDDHFHWISAVGQTDVAEGHAHKLLLFPESVTRTVVVPVSKVEEIDSGEAPDYVYVPHVEVDDHSVEFSGDTDLSKAAVDFGWETLVKAGALENVAVRGTSRAVHLIHHGVSRNGLGEADFDAVVKALGEVVLVGSRYPGEARKDAYEHLARHLKDEEIVAPPLRDYLPEEWDEAKARLEEMKAQKEISEMCLIADSMAFDIEEATKRAVEDAFAKNLLNEIRGIKED